MFFIGLQALFFLSIILCMLLGVAGVIFSGPLYIIFLFAFMLAASNIQTGNTEITVGILFKTLFKEPAINIRLIVLGGLYTLTLILLSWASAFAILLFISENDLLAWQIWEKAITAEAKNISLDSAQLASAQKVGIFYMGKAIFITSIAQAFFIFTPALVYWEKLRPAKAIFFNMIALLKNFKSIIGYFFLTVLLMLCCVVAGGLGAILILWILGANSIGNILAFLLFFVAFASALCIMNISIYIAFKQMFFTPSENTPMEEQNTHVV